METGLTAQIRKLSKKHENYVTFPRHTWVLHVTVTFKRHIKTSHTTEEVAMGRVLSPFRGFHRFRGLGNMGSPQETSGFLCYRGRPCPNHAPKTLHTHNCKKRQNLGFIVDSENKWTFQEIKIPHTPLQARFPNLAQCKINCGHYYIVKSKRLIYREIGRITPLLSHK